MDRLLRYDEETAGGRMTTHMVTVADKATVEEALEQIRRQSEQVEDFYHVFVVDAEHRLVGLLPFKDLVISRPHRPIRSFMSPADIFVTPDLDQEEVARLMARYNLPSVAVVDEQGKLLGQVTFDDVIDVVEAETTEDMLKFGGVSPDEELAAGWQTAVRSRLPWLSINLGTAFLAGGVVYLSDHDSAHLGAGGVDADHRGHGRQCRDPGPGGHRAPARPGSHSGEPVRAGGGKGAWSASSTVW